MDNTDAEKGATMWCGPLPLIETMVKPQNSRVPLRAGPVHHLSTLVKAHRSAIGEELVWRAKSWRPQCLYARSRAVINAE